jgi:hypothetical protein
MSLPNYSWLIFYRVQLNFLCEPLRLLREPLRHFSSRQFQFSLRFSALLFSNQMTIIFSPAPKFTSSHARFPFFRLYSSTQPRNYVFSRLLRATLRYFYLCFQLNFIRAFVANILSHPRNFLCGSLRLLCETLRYFFFASNSLSFAIFAYFAVHFPPNNHCFLFQPNDYHFFARSQARPLSCSFF